MEEKNNKSGSVTGRLGSDFDKELCEIKQKRLDSGIDKKRKSTRRLTDLIPLHKNWPKIKEDMINIKLVGKNEK